MCVPGAAIEHGPLGAPQGVVRRSVTKTSSKIKFANNVLFAH